MLHDRADPGEACGFGERPVVRWDKCGGVTGKIVAVCGRAFRRYTMAICLSLTTSLTARAVVWNLYQGEL